MGKNQVGSFQSRLHALKVQLQAVKGTLGFKDECRAASALRELEEYGRKLQSRMDKATREWRQDFNECFLELEPSQLSDTDLMDHLGMFDIGR